MEIRVGKRFDKETTYQDRFDEQLVCFCLGERTMFPILQFCDDEGTISKDKPKEAKLWPHDSMVLVVYMCKECLNTKVIWNQA